MTNRDSILKSRDVTLPTKIRLVKAMVLPVVMYGCESWTIKKVKHWRIDAFELWCWRRLESPLDCKEIQPVHPKGDQSWVFIGRTDVGAETPILWPPDVKSWLIGKDPDAGKDWRQEEMGMTDDERVSPTQWTWVWVNSQSWWWTGKPGMMQSMGWQRVRHDWATELNWRLCLSTEVVRKWVFTERTISKLVLPTCANWGPEKFTWSHITPGSSPILTATWGLQIVCSSRNVSQTEAATGDEASKTVLIKLRRVLCFICLPPSMPHPSHKWESLQGRPNWREELRERETLVVKRVKKPSSLPLQVGVEKEFCPFFKICPPLPCSCLILCDSRTPLF